MKAGRLQRTSASAGDLLKLLPSRLADDRQGDELPVAADTVGDGVRFEVGIQNCRLHFTDDPDPPRQNPFVYSSQVGDNTRIEPLLISKKEVSPQFQPAAVLKTGVV